MAAGDEQFIQTANEDNVDRLLGALERNAVGRGKARHYEKREHGRDRQERVIYDIYLIWDE